jgi:prepilin-type N-terminal cleavage/methylation domain-containing protein
VKTTTTIRVQAGRGAFTLIELLVVLVIIGIIFGIGIPAIRGFGESNAMAAANRQLLDDFSYARQRAVTTRSTVYVLFVSPAFWTRTRLPADWSAVYTSPAQKKAMSPLLAGQYRKYALFSRRSVGDQPGRQNPRYLTEWRDLPENILVPEGKFQAGWAAGGFATDFFPFPASDGPEFDLPYIAFDYQGRLISQRDEVVPLTRGSVFYARDPGGVAIPGRPDILETPPGNSTNNFNQVRIDWLTGRARVERLEIK